MNRRGFTLIELMIVIAISGMVAAAGGAFYLESRAATARIETNIELQRSASLVAEVVARDLRAAVEATNTERGLVIRGEQTIVYELDAGELKRSTGAEPWMLTRHAAAIDVQPWEHGWKVHIRLKRELLEDRRVVFDREVLVRRTIR